MRVETNFKKKWMLKSKRKYYIETEKIHVRKRKKIKTYIEINS